MLHAKQETKRRIAAISCVAGLVICVITAVIIGNGQAPPKPHRQIFWPISKSSEPEFHLIRKTNQLHDSSDMNGRPVSAEGDSESHSRQSSSGASSAHG